ncbi:GlxA family transcriptional regulator [Thiohalorhabdus sp. Cl-TMA]|uniref:GlxA family transcriptional regulator n=1 Tax=Thiohalorhabdus methylotrophus TaxID=3242694 RepID=A0ABV4TXJ8_9GAMM
MAEMTALSAPSSFGFLVVPNFSMIAFAAAVDALRMANQLTGRCLFNWYAITSDGSAVEASNGFRLIPEYSLEDAPNVPVVLVCGGTGIERATDRRLTSWLRRLASGGTVLGGICTGSHLLAAAGLLDGYRCTVHWEYIPGMRENFPRADISREVFVVDRNRITCAGGSAPLDLMLHLIAKRHGRELAASISEEFVGEHMRGPQQMQPIPMQQRLATSHPKLLEAVALMETNIEEPIDLDELAGYVGLSRRQLERLSRKYLGCPPTRYYLELRLARARRLLVQTALPIHEVALACGFVSAPHFSKCYRDFFGQPPSADRRRRNPETRPRSSGEPPEDTGELPEGPLAEWEQAGAGRSGEPRAVLTPDRG